VALISSVPARLQNRLKPNLNMKAPMMTTTLFWMILLRGICHLFGVHCCIPLICSLASVAPPKVDETNIGNRDPALERTYKGLPKLRCVQISCCL